jgi:hypothetical protein
MDAQGTVKKCYEWQRGKRGMQRRDKEVNEELESTALTYVYFNQKKDHFREIKL